MSASPKTPKPDLRTGLLPGLIGYRLRLAHQAVFRDFAATIPEISPGRAGMLLLIEANPGVTQGRLASASGLDRSTMVGVVDALEAAGLVERRRGEDRRTNGLWLTLRGRGALNRIKRRILEHERRIGSRLTAHERGLLIDLLGRLAG